MVLRACQSVLILILGSVLLFGADGPTSGQHESTLSIIPRPLSVKRDDGRFLISKATCVSFVGSSEVHRVAADLAARLRTVTGYPLAVAPLAEGQKLENAIVMALVGDGTLGSEGYRLKATKKLVRIEAARPAGLFYGVQTLYQLMPVAVENNVRAENVVWSVPCVRIDDKPRFSWRGMHLDVGRHFFAKESVKRYIDLIASYKMNMFHWHLTEDQGWRIEIRKHPRLTTVGAWRKETMNDHIPYGGFYTQDDVREIVEYARLRFITVVPEIEMPGHSQAALAAYPELSCSGGPFKVATEWGVLNDVYCAGNEKTFQFLEDVIDEVSALFPGPFFHIGGDECPKLRWSNCKRCQDRIAALGLKNEQELQSYFIKRVEKLLDARGKRLVGWDEILEGGLAPNATVMSWQGVQGGIEAAKSGHDVVMTPTSYCYFYYYQGTAGEPKAAVGFLPVDTVYSYEPVPPDLSPEEARHVLGAQGNVWTEWMPDYRQVEYMAATRMMALSEVVWSDKSQRDFDDFTERMLPQYQRLTIRDINFRVPTPLGIGGRKIIFHDTVATMKSPIPHALLYYTLDGQDPTSASTQYTKPIAIKGDQTLKAMLLIPGGKASNPITTWFHAVDPKINGVTYNYFEGEWVLLPDMGTMTPLKSGKIFDIDLAGLSHPWGNYGFQFKCLVDIPADGDYTLYLATDYGSRLYLDGKLLINNDGLHSIEEVSGKATLSGGKHNLEVRCFQSGGASDLTVFIEGPGMHKQPLPPRMLSIQ